MLVTPTRCLAICSALVDEIISSMLMLDLLAWRSLINGGMNIGPTTQHIGLDVTYKVMSLLPKLNVMLFRLDLRWYKILT